MWSSWRIIWIFLCFSSANALPQKFQIDTVTETDTETIEKNSTTNLRWLNDHTMKITFPNGIEDLIFLTISNNIPGVKDSCTFRGKFWNDDQATAAIVGCNGDKETLVNIASKTFDGGLKEFLIVDGATLEEVFTTPTGLLSGESNGRSKRSPQNVAVLTGGTVTPNKPTPNIAAAWTGALPEEITMKVNLAYDESLYQFFSRSSSATKKYINQVFELSRPHLRLLDTKVNLQAVGDVEHLEGKYRADDFCGGIAKYVQDLINSRKGATIPLTVLTEDNQLCRGSASFTSGCAHIGNACANPGNARQGDAGLSINDMSQCSNSEISTTRSAQRLAKTYAHETGHLLGMSHDFDAKHGGKGGSCDGDGFMSYGSFPVGWSRCSNSDFKNYFLKDSFTCLEFGETSCGGHRAQSCRDCGTRSSQCNGDCSWNSRARLCQLKSESFTIKSGQGWLDKDGRISTLKETQNARSSGDCETDCLKTPSCVGFTYIPSASRCDLKTNEQAVELSGQFGSSISSGTLTLRKGAGWHDADGGITILKKVAASKASQCEGPCRSTSSCIGWTYVQALNQCDLKDKSQAVSYSFRYSDVVSGLI